MKPSITHAAWLLALWHASFVLGQEDTSSGIVNQEPPVVTDAAPEPSVVPDVSVTAPLEGEPGETSPAEPGVSSTEVNESSSSEAETSTEKSETPLATPSESDSTDSVGTPTETSGTPTDASGTPTPTDEDGDGDKIVLVKDPSVLKNSTDDFVPAKITEDTRLAELDANKPSSETSKEDAQEIAILEGSLFNDFVENAPAPPDVGKISIPLNTSECDLNLDKRIWPFKDRPKRPNFCKQIREMAFEVHYNFILPKRDAEVPPGLWRRVAGNHNLMTKVFDPLGIKFSLRSMQNWWPPARGSNSDWTTIKKRETRLVSWQRQTHQGGKMSLNVWIVTDLTSVDANGASKPLLGYATFPKDIANNGKADGVVLVQNSMDDFTSGSDLGSTLVHEVGHWLGLYHTFGSVVSDESKDCQGDDGLLDTTHTRGLRSIVFQCSQRPCVVVGDVQVEGPVYNWMSYSSCPGGPDATKGFTTDQKAAMFARSIKYRRGINSGECNPSDPDGRVSKRSTMQDLVDGKCPDVKKAVEELQKFDKEVTDESEATPPTGENGKDEDDMAANTRMLSSFGMGIVGTAILFVLM